MKIIFSIILAAILSASLGCSSGGDGDDAPAPPSTGETKTHSAEYVYPPDDTKPGDGVKTVSALNISENPSGDAGEVLYSIGAGDDPGGISYVHVDLSQSQIQSKDSLKGRYLKVGVKLNSSHSGFGKATIGSGRILNF